MKTHITHSSPVNSSKRILVTALTALALGLPASSLLAQDEGISSTNTNSSGNSQTNAPGGQSRPHGGPRLLPPHAAEILKLTDEQKQQLNDLQEEVKAKIESILTPAQLEQLKQMRPPHPSGGGGPEGGNPPPPPSTNQPAS